MRDIFKEDLEQDFDLYLENKREVLEKYEKEKEKAKAARASFRSRTHSQVEQMEGHSQINGKPYFI